MQAQHSIRYCIRTVRGVRMISRKGTLMLLSLLLLTFCLQAQGQNTGHDKPRTILVSVNGMELDIIRPLLLKDQMPNLTRVIAKGSYRKLRTVSAPHCPGCYSTLYTLTS